MAQATLHARLQQLRDTLLTGLVERDVAIRLALLAILSGEHLLLLGPPGTAKSLVARRLHLAVANDAYFERLLTRFTVPEELFGPLSIKGLEEDRYERLTQAYLPAASIAFLDEIFKANSAILNSLLTLLNEREFDNGTQRVKTPLIAVIGASNELPENEELDALYDRFLLRLHVGPVSKESFPDLLGLRGHVVPEVAKALKLSAADLAEVQASAEKVDVSEDIIVLLCELRDWCTSENIQVSDRRWRKIVKLLQVSAFSNGRTAVSVWDCWLLQHCLWEIPEEQEKVYDWYAARVGASAAMSPSQLTKIVVAWEGQLKSDQDSRSQVKNKQGQLLFKKPDGTATAESKGQERAYRGKEELYLSPADHNADRTNGGKGYTINELDDVIIYTGYNRVHMRHWRERDSYLADKNNWAFTNSEYPPMMEPTRHKVQYIRDCIQQIDKLKTDIDQYKAKLLQHIASMEQQIQKHLWVSKAFIEPASKTLQQTKQEVEALLGRMERLRKGFVLLPNEGSYAPSTSG